MRYLLAALLPTLALTAAAPAPESAAAGACSVSAFLLSGGPGNIHVRAAPSGQAAALPLQYEDGSGRADITGHDRGWFRISRIIDAESDKLMFEGEGWLPAAELGIGIANSDPRLYATPYRGARVLARLVPDESLVDLVGCSGDFLQVRFGRRVGWLSRYGQCSNPLTTCP
jgi:hypothetical protein